MKSEGFDDHEIEMALSRSNGKHVRDLTAYVRKTIENVRQHQTWKRVSAQDYSQRDYSGVHAELEAQQDQEMEEFMRQEKERGNGEREKEGLSR